MVLEFMRSAVKLCSSVFPMTIPRSHLTLGNHSVTRFILFAVLVGIATLPSFGIAGECPAPYTGRFENAEHGYAFVVPDGLYGRWQSPCDVGPDGQCTCMGVHGLSMVLSQTADISVFSSYAAWVEDGAGKIDVLNSIIKQKVEDSDHLGSTISQPHKVKLSGRTGYYYTETYDSKNLGLKMRRISYVFIGTGTTPVEVEIELTAPLDRISSYMPRFRRVLSSFKWFPDIH